MARGMKGVTADRREIALLLVLGLSIRYIWLVAVGGAWQQVDIGEATHAAYAFAYGKGIADAFFPGQGPTAHLLPTTILISGSILRVFGPESGAANLVLAGWALAQSFAGYLLLRLLFARIGTDPAAPRAGLALLCLLPAFAPQEGCDFRFWEGALAACLAAGNLLLLERLDRGSVSGWRPLIAAAALSALTFFVSPPVGLAVDLCWAVYAFRRLPLRTTLAFAAMSAAALALLIAPWALRNQRVMGQPIPLRSNFGLELALANHPAALSDAPRGDVFRARVLAIHPFDNPPAIAALRSAGGEVAYSSMLGRETWAWIRAHPADFLRLSLRHYRQFYVPDTRQLRFTNWRDLVQPRAIVLQLVGMLGIAGLAWGLARRKRFYGYIALYVATAGLPYALVQPVPRYSYLIYGILAYLAAQLLVDLGRVARRPRADRQQGGQPQTPIVTPAEVPGSIPPRASPLHL